MTAERIPGDRDPSQHDGRFEKRETMIEAAMREKHRVALVIFRAIEMYRYYRDQPDFEQRLDTVLNGLAPEHSSTPVEKIREAFQRMAKQEAQMIKAEQILNKITGSAKVSADVREENVGKYLFYVKTGKGGVARAKRHGGVMKLVVSEIDWKKICPGGDIGSGFFDSNFHSLQYSGETIQMPCFCLRAGVEEDRSDDHEEQHFFNTFATQLFVDLEVAGSGRNIQQYGPTRHTKDELLARIRDQSPASMAVNFIDFTETEYSRGYRWIADELEPPQLESQIKKLRSIEKPLENIEKIFQTREERELLTIMLMGIPLERMDFLLPIMNEYFNDLVQKSVWGRSALFQTPEETAREEGYESAFAMGNEQWQICLDKAMVAKRLFTSFSHQISLEDVTPEEAVVALNAKHERILEAARAVNSENVKRVENYCRGEMKAYTAYEAFRQTFANTDDDPDATPRRLLFSNWEKRLFEKVAGHADYPENFTAKLIGDTWVLFIYDSFQNCGLNSGSTDTTIPANTAEVESQVVENGPTIHIKAVEAKGCFYNIQRVVQTDLIRRFIYGQFLDDKEPAPVGSMRQTQSAQHCIKTRAISFLEADYFDLATLRKRQLNMPDKIVGQNENVVNDKKIVDVLKKLVQFIEEEKDFYLLIRDEFSYLLFSAPFLQWPELFNRVRSEVRNLGVNISEIRSRTNENYKELAKCFVGKKIYRADADSGTLNLEEAARYLVNKDGGGNS